MKESDPVHSPAHYTAGGYELKRVFFAFGLHKHAMRWQAAKYLFRAGKKDPAKEAQDLEKAIECLQMDLRMLRGDDP